MSAQLLLFAQDVSRSFGGVKAVSGVSLAIDRGEVFGLIGPNGAGKTTFINLLTGLLRPETGTITFNQQAITRLPPHRIAAAGLGRTYQHIRLFPELTALENVIVGRHAQRHARYWKRLLLLPEAAREEAETRHAATALLEELGLAHMATVPARALAYGDRRRLEIARALASRPTLLLLDEPAAGMGAAEVEQLMALIRGFPARGLSVLLVEHNMRVVMEVCQRIGVLNFGQLIALGSPADVRANQAVIEAYLGREDT